MTTSYRVAIVGAASIRGKQLNEALAESSFAASEFLLMDDQEALGQLEAVGDEITFIQPITPDSFERVDFTFFCGSPELTRRHWQAAQKAGSSIVDLSGGLEGVPGVLVYAPWLQEAMGEAAAGRRAESAHPGRGFGSPRRAGAGAAGGAAAAGWGPFTTYRRPSWSPPQNMAGRRSMSCTSRQSRYFRFRASPQRCMTSRQPSTSSPHLENRQRSAWRRARRASGATMRCFPAAVCRRSRCS